MLGVPDEPGASLAIFSKIAAKNIAVDMIVQNVGAEGEGRYFVHRARGRSAGHAARRSQEAADELGAEGFSHDDDVSKISVVGLGMATQTGVAERMFRALADAGINILMITTSEIKISVLVARDQAPAALRTVHRGVRAGQANRPASRIGPPAAAHAGRSGSSDVEIVSPAARDGRPDDRRQSRSTKRKPA